MEYAYAYANVIERFEGSATAGAAAPKLAAVFTFGEGIVGQTSCTPTATSGAHDCPAAQERIIHADGFGSTRYLTTPEGAITDRIDYDAFGNEIHREGTTSVEHLYRGEQFDPNLGWYYLRARYMDPASGRFARMDDWRGNPEEPRSLHKYVYASGDAANYIDPSGYASLVDSSMAQTVNAILISSAIAVGGTAAAMVARDSISRRTADRAATQACAASLVGATVNGPVCGNTSIPILFVTPTRTPEIAEHILRSQASGRPRLLSRTALPPVMAGHRSLAYLHCSMGTNRVAPDSGSSCDEYPYASTYEGGLYATVRKVPLWEQFVQGGELSAFYGLCGIPGDVPVFNEFVVAPVAQANRLFQCGVFR